MGQRRASKTQAVININVVCHFRGQRLTNDSKKQNTKNYSNSWTRWTDAWHFDNVENTDSHFTTLVIGLTVSSNIIGDFFCAWPWDKALDKKQLD